MVESQINTRPIMERDEVAALFRVHPSTVTRWTQAGGLVHYRVGSRLLFRKEDVWAFFEKHRVRESVSGKEGNDGEC